MAVPARTEQNEVSIPERAKWFVNDRFGMFIHWGLYALPARHEWVKNHEEISDEEYERYFKRFDPDLYDPELWADAAAKAGMRYVVMTSKHHEGFCLWDSKHTDYKAPNTPAGRDLLKPAAEAFRNRGLRMGFYYSLLDWHHPDFTIDPRHPQRNHPEALKMNEGRDMARYREYMRNQVTELLTEMGDIDVLWFDFSYDQQEYPEFPGMSGKGKDDWGSEEMVELVRKLRPEILLNDRLQVGGDIITPEQFQPQSWVKRDGAPVIWEACHTFSGSWGYHRDEASWKSDEQLIRLLVESVSRGGNLLMNVGPTGRGEFDERALTALNTYAEWMRLHSRSIYGCTQSPYPEPPDTRYTQNGRRLYAHLFSWPYGYLHLPELAGKVEYVQLLNDASELHFIEDPKKGGKEGFRARPGEGSVVVRLPTLKPRVTIPVVEIFLKEGAEAP